MKTRTVSRLLAVFLTLVFFAAACSSTDDSGGGSGDESSGAATTAPQDIDYESIGLWDDGPCDPSKPELKLGLMTVFQSPVISLEDQATALEASADAFNARGGANGHCIKVTTCDDGGNADQAVACVRTIDEAGVVATVNDQGTAGQADVSAAMADAGIPRVASNVAQDDWDDPNAYPIDASGTGVTFLLPQALINQDVKKIGLVRVDLAAASALKGLLESLYSDQGATFPLDVPVPAGTTDFTQFILAAQDAGVDGINLALGENEALQVVNAGQQLGTDLLIGSSLGSFSHKAIADLGDFAQQMVFLWSFRPPTFDLPVYTALRSDLAASGEDALQPENLKASPMRSWIGLYALLYMIRQAHLNDFTRDKITQLLQDSGPVPMLDMFGGEDWTPNAEHPGLWSRAGTDGWSTYTWDPEDHSAGFDGNWVESSDISFDETLCGSPFGAPAAQC